MNDSEKDVLLYWSDEADAETISRVELLLERNEAARTYLKELDEISEASKEFLEDIPIRRDGLLDEVLSASHRKAIVPEKSTAISWWGFSTLTKTAATIVLIGVATFLMFRPGDSNQNLVSNERSSNLVVSAENPTRSQMTLSERLLTRSHSFRSSDGGLDTLRRERARRDKLRINQFKS